MGAMYMYIYIHRCMMMMMMMMMMMLAPCIAQYRSMNASSKAIRTAITTATAVSAEKKARQNKGKLSMPCNSCCATRCTYMAWSGAHRHSVELVSNANLAVHNPGKILYRSDPAVDPCFQIVPVVLMLEKIELSQH